MAPEKATSLRRAVALLLALGGEEALVGGGLSVTRLHLPSLELIFYGQRLPPAGPQAPRGVNDLHERIAAAAPVRDHRSVIITAVNISAPAFRFEQRLAEAGERLMEVARELSLMVGRQPHDVSEPGQR